MREGVAYDHAQHAVGPDLAAVARVWPTLPESVKAEIVAMVKAAASETPPK